MTFQNRIENGKKGVKDEMFRTLQLSNCGYINLTKLFLLVKFSTNANKSYKY